MTQRVNVSLPDDLAAFARAAGLSPSRLLAEAIASRRSCAHEHLVCPNCNAHQSRVALVDDVVSRFYVEALAELGYLVSRGGTAAGAGVMLKHVATRWKLRAANHPLPRPTRAEREASNVRELPAPPAAALPHRPAAAG